MTHGYIISSLAYDIGSEACRQAGFTFNCFGCNTCAFEENQGYKDGTSKYQFSGKSKYTIKDIERMVENAIVIAYNFDYEAEKERFLERLDKRKTVMDEVNEWKNNRYKLTNTHMQACGFPRLEFYDFVSSEVNTPFE